MDLVKIDVENIIEPLSNGIVAIVKGFFDYYHYNCDGVNDEVRDSYDRNKFCLKHIIV